MYGNFQGVIQIFIRIVLRSIGRQEKYLDFLLVLFQPDCGKFAMVNLQIIQNQEHFLLRGTDQTLHEANEPLLVHGVLIDHKTDIALAADRRDHIDSLPLRLYWQYGRPALGRKAALYYLAVAYPCLIRPINDGIFCFRTPCNSRILLLFPPSDAIRILFPRALHRSLAAHAPALHVVRQRPFVDGFVELFLDVLPRSP